MDQGVGQDGFYDPMIYDVMLEGANQVGGRYVAWEREAREAGDAAAAKHWQEEDIRLSLEVRAVNADSRSAVEAKTAELSELLRGMPWHAPALG